ncbi:MAG: ATP-binding protein [Nannocystales bacterium]
MSAPSVAPVDDALDELVNQFSDPLSFLRELVQNAIDAGSHEVEINTSFEAKGDAGTAVIAVSDWGGGMSREIIETKLTRLFSSQKDGDRTKIGKFGIGFVSVFAIGPEVVCVDTARDGEAWRVLFDETRAFRLLRLDEPIEGTTIRVYKSMSSQEFSGFEVAVRKTVTYWCKHAVCDIRVDGEPIAVPFGYSNPCSVEHDDGYSRVSASHPPNSETFLGLYNGGLTLVELDESPHPGTLVRAWSPHLEHTLTRDAVIKDEGHARVMAAIADTVHGPLALRAFENLETELRSAVPTPWRNLHHRCVRWHVERGLRPQTQKGAAQSVVALTPSAEHLTLGRLMDGVADDLILITRTQGPLSDAVAAAGKTVVHAGHDAEDGALLKSIGSSGGDFTIGALEAHWALPLPLRDAAEHAAFDPLAEATRSVFRNAGHKVSQVQFGHFDYPGSSLTSRVAVSQPNPFSLTPLEDVTTLGRGFFARSRPVIVNVDHPATQALGPLAQRDLPLAAYMLAKLFFVGSGLTPSIDGELAAAAHELGER